MEGEKAPEPCVAVKAKGVEREGGDSLPKEGLKKRGKKFD